MDDPRSAVEVIVSVPQCSSRYTNFPASTITSFIVITFPAVFFSHMKSLLSAYNILDTE
jgi:hypothetical protein